MRRIVRTAFGGTVLLVATSCAVPPRGGARRGGSTLGDAAADALPASAACANVKCAALECEAGFVGLPLPGECCPTLCVPDDCSTVDCPPLSCPTGTHEGQTKNPCCNECIASSPGAGTCEDGQAAYATYLQQLLGSTTSSSCNVDADCKLVSLDNACGVSCGTAVSVRGAPSVVASATAYANAHCGACAAPSPCPPVERFARCAGGTCSAF